MGIKTLIGIGNAAVDAVVEVSGDTALNDLHLVKGGCVFVDGENNMMQSALRLYPDRYETPGGASANAVATYAALGGSARFIGKAGADAHGDFFTQSMRQFNIAYDTLRTTEVETTFLFAFVTPDKERTFLSNHGSSHKISAADVHEEWFTPDVTLIIDGYMLMSGGGPEAMFQAMDYAQKHGSEIIFMPCSLSVIDNNRDLIDRIIARAHAIICNADEAITLTHTDTIEEAYTALQTSGKFDWGVVTLGQDGAFYFDNRNTTSIGDSLKTVPGVCHSAIIPIPYPADHIKNTNGAGDAFSGGLIYGLHHGMDMEAAINLGHKCAIHVIQQEGPRPAGWLSGLLNNHQIIDKAV